MREKLNENPMAQVAVVGVLLVLAVVFLLGKAGGGSEEEGEGESSAATAAVAAVETELEAGSEPAQLPAPGSGVGALPPPPGPIVDAFDAGQTVAAALRPRRRHRRPLGGGERSSASTAIPNVATFVVPSRSSPATPRSPRAST